MQIEKLFQIWDRFEKSKATEFVFESEGEKICLKKENKEAAVPVVQNIIPQAAVPVMTQPAASAPVSTATAVAKDTPVSVPQEEISGTPVKAPFVGTFYRSPAPGEDPFVILGQKVNKGDVIGIIEAMKLMNEITAPCDGTITDIFVEDETLVEYDQLLVSIGD